MPNAWDRQPNESNRAYSYFNDFYLSLDPSERSLNKAYQKFLESKNPLKTRYKPATGTWCNYFRGCDGDGKKIIKLTWKQRAEAYDQYLNEKKRKERERLIEKLQEKERDASDRLFKRAEEMLEKKPDKFKQSEIAITYKTASELARKSLGADVQKHEHKVDMKVNSKKKIKKTVMVLSGEAALEFMRKNETVEQGRKQDNLRVE